MYRSLYSLQKLAYPIVAFEIFVYLKTSRTNAYKSNQFPLKLAYRITKQYPPLPISGWFICILCVLNVNLMLAQNIKLESWQADKFSMFIHFGLYSHLGGVWQGKQIERGYSEQIQSHAGIHSDLYAAEAAHFNPSQWNADSIVSLAKRAGMRSLVITSKHHDGFCMFDTETTNFNIVDATPFGRDVLKELSEACRRGGLNFGLYFSLIDWHYPQAYPISSHNADFITPEHHNYNKAQLKELLTQYGPISELWFDMGSLTYNQSKELRDLVHQYQPNCLVSGRLGNDQGDFCVMGDNQYPDYNLAVPWQVPASVYDETWGHRSWQRKVPIEDKVAEKVRSLVQTAARGGNYLLNIGPDAEGDITSHEREVLEGIGDWMAINREAIYGTTPVSSTENEVLLAQKGDTLFAYVIDDAVPDKLILNGITQSVRTIDYLDQPGRLLSYTHRNNVVEILSSKPQVKTEEVRVLRLILDRPYVPEESEALRLTSRLALTPENAIPEYSFSGVDYYSSYRSTVGYAWNLISSASVSRTPTVMYTAHDAGKHMTLNWDGKDMSLVLEGGSPVALPNSKIDWGPVFLNGPHAGFIHTPIADPALASADRDWGGTPWIQMELVDMGAFPKRPAGMFQNWYWLQELTAAENTEHLVQIPLNDGLAVYLNGKSVYVGNNPTKESGVYAMVLLKLRKGKNSLLVKYFNRFNTHVTMGVDAGIPQQLYLKTLPEVQFSVGQPVKITLSNEKGSPVHRGLTMTYVKLLLN